jgi:hypothetical protein
MSFLAGSSSAVIVALGKYFDGYNSDGWASLFALMLTLGGLILFALGIIAEYLGLLVRRAVGVPLYVIGNDPHQGPFQKQ